jgi:hypothetical protein
MVDFFDISILSLIGLGAFFFKYNKNNVIISLNLVAFFILNMIDLSGFGHYYYLVVCLFELLFISMGLSMKVKTSILIIFLISLGYNALSILEFNLASSYIYDSYSLVMSCLVVSLLILNTYYGFKNGTNNRFNTNSDSNSDSYSRFFRWGSQ